MSFEQYQCFRSARLHRLAAEMEDDPRYAAILSGFAETMLSRARGNGTAMTGSEERELLAAPGK